MKGETVLRPGVKTFDAVLLLICLGIAAFFLFRVNYVMHYDWRWGKIPQFLFRYDPETRQWVSGILMRGLYNTLRLSIWGILLATLLGTVMGVCRCSRILFLRLISGTYVETLRNLPPLVVILIAYYFIGDQVLPGFALEVFLSEQPPAVQQAAAWLLAAPAYLTAFLSALATLVLLEGAYITEIVRSGIASIHRGQHEAAGALGFSRWQRMRHVVLPQAFQRILPPLAGQFISLIKDSSIVSVISIQELTFQGTELMTSTLLTMEIWITVTGLYLMLTLPCSLAVERLEARYHRRRA